MMKQSTKIGKLLLISIGLMLSLIAKSQAPTYEMYVTNQTQVSSKVYQFDVYLLKTGSASQLELASLQFGLGFDTMIVNGGTVSFSFVSGSSQLGANQVPTSFGIGSSSQVSTVNGVTYRFMNQATRALPGSGNGSLISAVKTGCTSPGTRVGTYRLTNTVDFRNSSSSKHIFNVGTGSGRTNTIVTAYVGGLNTTLSGTQMGYLTTGTCDQNVVFNPCNVSASASGIVSACPGLNNGSAVITLAGMGSSASGKYFINDDTVGVAYSGNPFTIGGLDVGSYSVTVSSGTGPCPASVSFSVDQAVLTSEFSATSCDSYVWSGTTYTASGVYTQTFASVNNCDSVVTANITINQSKTSSYDTTVCGSYTLPWDDEVLESGEYVHTYTTVDGCDSVVTVNVTVNTVPVASISTANDATELTCTVTSISATASGAGAGGSYLWSPGGVTTATTSLTSAGTYTVTATTADGCSAEASVTITLGGQIPAAPGTVTASVNPVCGSGTTTLSVTAGAGTTIDWYSAAEGGTALRTGNAAGVNTYPTPAITNTTTYYAETRNLTGGCKSDTRTPIVIVYGSLPSAPTTTGGTRCGSGSVTVSVPSPVSGTEIDWYSAATAGTLIRSNTASFDSSVIVTTAGVARTFFALARTGLGCVSTRTPAIANYNANAAPPASITIAPTANSNTCGARVYRYTAPALPAGTATVTAATGYEWVLTGALGATGTITFGDASSQIIEVTYTSNALAGVGDSIKLRYITACGYTAYKASKLSNTLLATPIAPAAITITAVSPSVCGAKVYRYAAPALPGATATVTAATGYEWSFTGSLGSNATIDSGDVNSSVIRVVYTSNAAALTGDSVKVCYQSACGNGAFKASKLTNVATTVPAIPSSIIITPITPNECNSRVYRYTAPVLPAATATAAQATGYQWQFKGALTGNGLLDTSIAVIDSGDVNSRIIRIKYKTNALAAITDSVKLRYTSSCGESLYRGMKLSNTLLATPAAPASITITAVAPSVCGAKVYRYAAPALPGATATVTAATGYVWSFTGSLGSNASIDSGDVNSRVIRVVYTSNAAGLTGDSVKVCYQSACGNGAFKASKLTNVATLKPAAPTAITITAVAPSVCGAKVYRYAAPALPGATATVAAATGYEWSFTGTLGSNASIDSGDVNSRVIRVVFSSDAAALTGDSVKVRYQSACGPGAFRASKLTNVATKTPPVPASITIALISDVCGARVYRYTAPALTAASATVAAATGYEWSFKGNLGNNGTITSGTSSSQIIEVTYTSNAAAIATDSVKLRYTSSCGYSLYKGAKLTNLAKVCLPTSRELPITKAAPEVAAPKVSESMSVKVYPNPTTSNFNMQVITAENEPIGVRVMDAQGRVLKTLRVDANETTNIGSELRSGSYFIEVRQGKNVKTTRVLKF